MTFNLRFSEIENANGQPTTTLFVSNDDQEVVRRDLKLLDEADFKSAARELADVCGCETSQIEQCIAENLIPLRRKWLQERNRERSASMATQVPAGADQPDVSQQAPPTTDKATQQQLAPRPAYYAVYPSSDDKIPTGPSMRKVGVRDDEADRVLCNFVLLLDEDIEIQDDFVSKRCFAGRLITAEKSIAFRIDAEDFADNGKFRAALFKAGGCGLVIDGTMDSLRKAVSVISASEGQRRTRRVTVDFGWTKESKDNKDRAMYLSPSYRVSAAGIEKLDEQAELRVDLAAENVASSLDLLKLDAAELQRVKRHIVTDLLALADSRVTYSLLAATGAAILYPWAPGAGRFALWLTGLTGSGKSFLAKHFMNFFGNFPVSSAPFTTWSATHNFVQQQGYYFKDAIYLVDDYKPEVIQSYQIVKVLQTYADNTARGRLKSDATANVSRPIRGLLISTGEDVPEHHASALARSVIIPVSKPERTKLAEGGRCLKECRQYAGVTAGFIHWLLQEDRLSRFENRFLELQQRYNADVSDQQNGIRVASNLAQLGAAFELWADFLGDVWPNAREEARRFVEKDLIEIRSAMLSDTKEQQASEIFLRHLAELIQYNRVRIDGLSGGNVDQAPLIGRFIDAATLNPERRLPRLEISMPLALAEINKVLREEGRAEIKATERTLYQQLREDGQLLGQNGQPLTDPNLPATYPARIGLLGQRRVFAIGQEALLG